MKTVLWRNRGGPISKVCVENPVTTNPSPEESGIFEVERVKKPKHSGEFWNPAAFTSTYMGACQDVWDFCPLSPLSTLPSNTFNFPLPNDVSPQIFSGFIGNNPATLKTVMLGSPG